MSRYLVPKIPKFISKPSVCNVRFISNAKGLSPYTTGIHFAMLDENAHVSLHYIPRYESMFQENSVDDIQVNSSIINATTLWIAPNDDGTWDLKNVIVSNSFGDATFDANIEFSEGIQLGLEPKRDDKDVVRYNDEYRLFQKESMDKQLIISCLFTLSCATIRPEYAIWVLTSSTIGTVYLFLLEKQVETLGKSPLTVLITYQTRMVVVSGFLIYTFTEYSKTNDLTYLMISGIGFFLYRLTLLV